MGPLPLTLPEQDNPIALQEKIMSTKGWKIANRIRPVGISYYIFNQNCEELKQFLVAYSKPEVALEISRVGNRRKLDAFLKEVMRRLHNYLASAMSLVDHTFLLVRDLYKGTPFEKEYHGERNRRFTESPQLQFVQQLRNYALHQSIVDAVAITSWSRDEPLDTSIKLHLETLRTWKGWKGRAKEYVKTAPKDVKVLDLVEAYTAEVRGFYEWLSIRQQQIHKKEFDELNTLQSGYRQLVSGFLVGDELSES